MEFKGTKGKWVFSKSSLSIWHLTDIGRRLALVYGVVKDGIVLNGETQANALLISKAPEMLEELKLKYEYLEELAMIIPDDSWTGEFRAKWNSEMNSMEQLIKQATELK